MNKNLWIWISFNVIWWIISMVLCFINIDVNPLLNDLGEVIANGIIFIIGLFIIWREKDE